MSKIPNKYLSNKRIGTTFFLSILINLNFSLLSSGQKFHPLHASVQLSHNDIPKTSAVWFVFSDNPRMIAR